MKFTFDANPAAEQVIANHQSLVAATVAETVPSSFLSAIVMIGGYGRHEGAYVIDQNGKPQPYNDYDYFVVFRNISRRKAWEFIAQIPNLEHETGIDVDFFPLLEAELPSLEFSLMNAEMQAGHAVIWGDVDVLRTMPSMPLSDVPMTEFERLLTNRGCLLLMNRLDPQRPDFSKFINKAWLAIGDAVLATQGAYCLSYLEKRERAAASLNDETMVKCYQRAIDIRMRPDRYAPWKEADLPAVTLALLQTLENIRSAAPSRLSLKPVPGNIIRHLLDRRLPKLDRKIIHHPRQRVTAALKTLLKNDNSGFNRGQGEELLTLWGRYS